MTAALKWKEARAEVIGASEVPAVLGLSPWKSPYSLWAEKTGLVVPDQEETDPQYWGNRLEAIICEEYGAQTGRQLIDHGRYAVKRSETCPVLGCTLDREVVAFDARGNGVMDAKNVGAFKASEWDGDAPYAYQAQIQAQLEVTGLRWGSLAVLIGGQQFRWIDFERDERVIAVIRAKCLEFWKCVEERRPPPIDGNDATTRALKELYPQDNGASISLPGEAHQWDDIITAAELELKQAEHKIAEAKNNIRAAIGEASIGVLPGGGSWSFKTQTQTRKATEEKVITMRVLRRLKK